MMAVYLAVLFSSTPDRVQLGPYWGLSLQQGKQLFTAEYFYGIIDVYGKDTEGILKNRERAICLIL